MRGRSSTWRWQPVLAGPAPPKPCLPSASTRHQQSINSPSTPRQHRINKASTLHQHGGHSLSMLVLRTPTSGPRQRRASRSHGKLVVEVIKPAESVNRPATGSHSRRWMATACHLLGHQHGINISSTKRQRRVYAASTQHQHTVNATSTKHQHGGRTTCRRGCSCLGVQAARSWPLQSQRPSAAGRWTPEPKVVGDKQW